MRTFHCLPFWEAGKNRLVKIYLLAAVKIRTFTGYVDTKVNTKKNQVALNHITLNHTLGSSSSEHCLTINSTMLCPPSSSKYPWSAMAMITWANMRFICKKKVKKREFEKRKKNMEDTTSNSSYIVKDPNRIKSYIYKGYMIIICSRQDLNDSEKEWTAILQWLV